MNLVSAFVFVAACCVTPSDFNYKNTIHIVENSHATWLKPLAAPSDRYAYVPVTALDAPIITNKPKGTKNKPICHIKFLKKGK